MTVKKYLCGAAFTTELGETDEIGIYDSIEELKASGTCHKQCGIVELEVKEGDDPEFYYSYRWVEKQDMEWKK